MKKRARSLENKSRIQLFASRNYDKKSVFYIGRGLDYALAQEASLKLKEISYIHSEALAAGELKHGTIALIEDGTLLIAVATQQALMDKIKSNITEWPRSRRESARDRRRGLPCAGSGGRHRMGDPALRLALFPDPLHCAAPAVRLLYCAFQGLRRG